MKRFRILASSLVIAALGTVCAFADVAPEPDYRNIPGAYIFVAVAVIIIALVLLRAMIKKRRLKNDGVQPEEPNDINVR